MGADGDSSGLGPVKAALGAFIARASGAEAVEIAAAHKLSGGAIQENWWLQVQFRGGPQDEFPGGTADLVLRSDSPTGVAVSRSRAEEFRLLQVARDAGVTVPAPL